MDKLPIYRFLVPENDDEIGVSAVALVDYPAIEMNWQAFAAQKISMDYDDTLSTERGKQLAKDLISKGNTLYIISARNSKDGMLSVANELGIPESRVYATGSNKAKVEKIKELGIVKHYDNNKDVIKELGSNGLQFVTEPSTNETKDEFISRCISIEVGNGYDESQAAAMCYAKWDEPKIKNGSLKFSADTEKRIISGPLMVAELPIYRRDESGEYYGLFTADDIYNIVKKFFRNNNTAQVNMMHDSQLMVSGVYMIESFIIDSKRGILSPKGYNLTDGSWFGSFKVDNEDVWENYIKTGDFKGFSVEGMFKTVAIDSQPQTTIDKIIDVVKGVDASKIDEVMSILKKANIN